MDKIITKGFSELSAIEKEEINGGLSPVKRISGILYVELVVKKAVEKIMKDKK